MKDGTFHSEHFMIQVLRIWMSNDRFALPMPWLLSLIRFDTCAGTRRMAQAILIFLSLASPFAQASALNYDLANFKPATLSYKASKFFVSAEARIQQRIIPSEQAVGQLLALSQGEGLMPNQDQIILQTLETKVMGQQTKIETWLNPDAGILQRSSLYTGRKNWFRTYRYIPAGAYSVKRQPASKGEQNLPHNQWSDVSTRFYQLEDVPLNHPLSETEALFYLLSVAKLSQPGDELQLPVFDKDEVIGISVVVEKRVTLPVNFKEITDQGEKRISGKQEVLRARLSARPLGDQANASDFEFLGYSGDVELYIDPQRRVILQMSGKYDYLGKVDIRLQELDYR